MDINKVILKFILWVKRLRLANTIIFHAKHFQGLTVPGMKIYYKATVNKRAWQWCIKSNIDQCNKIAMSGIDLHKYVNNSLTMEQIYNSFNKWCCNN